LRSENNRKAAVSAWHKAKKFKRLLERIKRLDNELRQFQELLTTVARLREENDNLLTAQV